MNDIAPIQLNPGTYTIGAFVLNQSPDLFLTLATPTTIPNITYLGGRAEFSVSSLVFPTSGPFEGFEPSIFGPTFTAQTVPEPDDAPVIGRRVGRGGATPSPRVALALERRVGLRPRIFGDPLLVRRRTVGPPLPRSVSMSCPMRPLTVMGRSILSEPLPVRATRCAGSSRGISTCSEPFEVLTSAPRPTTCCRTARRASSRSRSSAARRRTDRSHARCRCWCRRAACQ